MATSSYTGPNGTTYYYNTKGRDNDAQANIAAMTNQANIDIAKWTTETQNQQNIDFWNMQNEYNTPSAQIQRLKEAQLNPSFYGLEGNGNASQLEAATNMPNLQNPSYFENNQLSGILASAQQATDSIYKALSYYNDTERMEAEIAESQKRQVGLNQENYVRGYDLMDKESRRGIVHNEGSSGPYQGTGYSLSSDDRDSEMRSSEKSRLAQERQIARKTELETSILEAGAPAMSQLSSENLKKLQHENKLLDFEEDKEQFKKNIRDLGLDPQADWVNNLFYMGLHDEDSYHKVVSGLMKAIGTSTKNILKDIIR